MSQVKVSVLFLCIPKLRQLIIAPFTVFQEAEKNKMMQLQDHSFTIVAVTGDV